MVEGSARLDPYDAEGRLLSVGARVRIGSIPNWLVKDLLADEVAWLRAHEGRVVVIAEFDKFGYVWFEDPASGFCLKPQEVDLVEP